MSEEEETRIVEKAWILYQDNTPAHTSIAVKQFFADNIPEFDHLPYSPYLMSCDFYLFPKLKSASERTLFSTVEEVKTEAANQLNGV